MDTKPFWTLFAKTGLPEAYACFGAAKRQHPGTEQKKAESPPPRQV